MNRRTSVTARMTLWFVAVVLSVVTILGVLNASLFSRRMSDSLIHTLEAVAKNSAKGVSLMVTHTDMLCQMVTDSKFTDSDNAYISYLLCDDENLVTSFRQYQELKDMFLKDSRFTLGTVFPTWCAALFLSEELSLSSKSFVSKMNLEMILSTYMENENIHILKNDWVLETEWYQKALEAGGDPYWFEKDGFLCMACSVSSLNQSSHYGEIHYYEMGVLLQAFRSEYLENYVFSGQLTENSCAWLYNAEGNTLWCSQPQIPQNALEIANEIDGGLKLCIYVPYRDITQMTGSTGSTLVLFLLLCAGLGGLLVLMVSGWISRPVRLLSAFMKEKKGEKLPAEMIPKPKDEIRDLYESYNELICAIRTEEEKRRKAEMDFLQLQINPHFLYNTLDSVCFLAMTSGQNEIADILSSLAGIYRYNIRNMDGEVMLREELEILRQYLDIYRFRSSERIDTEIEAGEELLQALIPKMILQPLVENAILYGLGEKSGTIRILCAHSEDKLILRVMDAGRKGDTDKMNAYLQGEGDLTVHSAGIGIKNVHQRIRMRYGEPYGLSYSKTQQGTTCAELLLPFRKEPQM